MDLTTAPNDMVINRNDIDSYSPTPPTRRRKSTRRSLLPVCSPVTSGTSSPVICRPRKSVLPVQITEPQHPAYEAHSPEKQISTDAPSSCTYTDEQLLEQYEREISGWERLVASTRLRLAQGNSLAVSLPPLEWIKHDRMLSRFHEIMVPLCDSSINVDISLPSLASLTHLAQKVCFELHCFQHLLNRQTTFLNYKRALIKADRDFVLLTTFANRSFHTYLKEFLSIPQ